MSSRPRWREATLAAALATSALLAACSSSTPAYIDLQNVMKMDIVKDDHRPVSSVACIPRVKDVTLAQGRADVNCLVRFPNAPTYTAHATIEARVTGIVQCGYHACDLQRGFYYSFDEPGPIDITTAALPPPSASIPATSAQSLFYARNLKPVVDALASQFSGGQLILRLALYPGELDAVIGANGKAWLVTAHRSGTLTVGPSTSFDGQRSGITISQLNPRVPERLARLIATRGDVPTSQLDHFTLSFPNQFADWNVYPATGTTRFEAHVMGDSLKQITPSGSRALN